MDPLKEHLREKKDKLEKKLAQKLKLIESKKGSWPCYVIDDTESDTKELEERIKAIDDLLNSEDAKNRQRFQQLRKRKAAQIIEQQQLKYQKTGHQGAPRKLDEEDEEFPAKCVEDKRNINIQRKENECKI